MAHRRRAGRFTRTLTQSQALTYRDDPKDVDGHDPIRWDGRPPAARLAFDVWCGEQRLEVRGHDRGPGNVIIRVGMSDAQGNLARICWSPLHGDDVHWHWWDKMVGLEEDRELVVLTEPSRSAMLVELIERLRIRGAYIEEGMV